MSLGMVLSETARRYPHHVAIKHEGAPITYRELEIWSNRLAHHFISAGLRPGDTVAVFMDTRPAVLAVVAAVAKAGGVAAMINSHQRKQVLIHSFRACTPVLYVVGEELLDAMAEVRNELGSSNDIADGALFMVRDGLEGPGEPETAPETAPQGYIDLDEAARLAPHYRPMVCDRVRLDDSCFNIFTSGTTGLPKASIMSHNRWVKAGHVFGGLCLDLGPGETLYAPLPLYHNQALTLAWSSACTHGAAIALRRKFSVSSFWEDCRRHGASAFVYIGEVPRYLINRPPDPGDRDHAVRRMVGIGLRTDIWQEFKARFGVEEVYELYAASEMNVAFVNAMNLDCTVGWCPAPWALVQFDVASGEPARDSRGHCIRVGKGEVGLLIAENSEKFKFEGYTDPTATENKQFRNVFKDGDVWVNSGDLMRDIGFGHLQFVDRVGDTFRWKSENVSTGEVELIINRFDGVAESTVYGVELPGAVGRAGMVSLTPVGPPAPAESTTSGAAPARAQEPAIQHIDLDELLRHMRSELPVYAIPLFIRITGPLEVTGTFKHRKVDLRQQGFDPQVCPDPLFVLMPGATAYQPLTSSLHDQIMAGDVSF